MPDPLARPIQIKDPLDPDVRSQVSLSRILIGHIDSNLRDWLERFPYRPRLAQHDHEVLKVEVVEQLKKAGSINEAEAETLLQGSDSNPEIVSALVRKNLAMTAEKGAVIPVFWIESADIIPEERRPKILDAIRRLGLLNENTGDLLIEFFDNRGDNRRAMVVAASGHPLSVFKYVHIARSPVEQQIGFAKTVTQREQLMTAMKVVEGAPTYAPPPVSIPNCYTEVEGTELYLEEYIDGPTRDDFVAFLRDVAEYRSDEIVIHLSRLEGQSLYKIWNSTREAGGRGVVIEDLTGRNVKYQHSDSHGFIARYFDFERLSTAGEWSCLQEYINNSYVPFLNNDGFIVGWLEGAGPAGAKEFFRLFEFDRDRIGLAARFVQGLVALDIHKTGETPLIDVEGGPGIVSRDDLDSLIREFVFSALFDTRSEGLPVSTEGIKEAVCKFLSYHFHRGPYNEPLNPSLEVFAQAAAELFTSPRTTDELGKGLLNLRKKASELGFRWDLNKIMCSASAPY